jgi:hypothetical protein
MWSKPIITKDGQIYIDERQYGSVISKIQEGVCGWVLAIDIRIGPGFYLCPQICKWPLRPFIILPIKKYRKGCTKLYRIRGKWGRVVAKIILTRIGANGLRADIYYRRGRVLLTTKTYNVGNLIDIL